MRQDAGVITVAVLPFADLGGKPENEYFSDGLTEELIHALTKVPGMRVVAWNTAAQLRDRQQDMRAIRDQLHVGTVLTGSVRIAGPSLRVRAQLIDTASGVYLWSETFDRSMQDVFAIQEEIARAIVRTLRVQLTGQRRRRASGARPKQHRLLRLLSARPLLLAPAHARRSGAQRRVLRGGDRRRSTIRRWPTPAWPTRTRCWWTTAWSAHPPECRRRRPRRCAPSNSTPTLAEAYASLALIRSLYDWEWEEARGLYQRAIELNPGYATAHHWLGVDWYALTGRFDEARAELEIALQLDPLSSIIREGQDFVALPGAPLRGRGAGLPRTDRG